jgi:hypothetical protein
VLGEEPELEDVVGAEAAPLVRGPAGGLAVLCVVAGGVALRVVEEVCWGATLGKRVRRVVAFVWG